MSFLLAGRNQALLFGISPTDGTTFAGVAALLLRSAPLASWIPRRAARIKPMKAIGSH